MHVEPTDTEPRPLGPLEHLGNVFVPDAVLRSFAAGVCLLAVAVTKAWVHPQRHAGSRHSLGQLFEHIGRAAINMDAERGNGIEALAIEDIGGVHDRVHRRQAVGGRRARSVGRIAGGHRSVDLADAHCVNHHSLTADQIQDGQIRAGFLGESHRIPSGQIAAATADHLGIVGIQGSAILFCQIDHAHTGNLSTDAIACGSLCLRAMPIVFIGAMCAHKKLSWSLWERA